MPAVEMPVTVQEDQQQPKTARTIALREVEQQQNKINALEHERLLLAATYETNFWGREMDLGKDFESPRGSPQRQWRLVDGAQPAPAAEHIHSLDAVRL